MAGRSSVSRTAGGIVGFAWRVILTAVLIYLLSLGITKAYSYGHGLLYEHAMESAPGTDQTFEIKKGEDRDKISEKLLQAGLIDNKTAFVLQSYLFQTHFVTGSYTLNTSMTIEDILSYLQEEGKKQQELKDKNLVGDDAAKAETSAAETDENGAEVIGGNEDVQDDTTASTEGVTEGTAAAGTSAAAGTGKGTAASKGSAEGTPGVSRPSAG